MVIRNGAVGLAGWLANIAVEYRLANKLYLKVADLAALEGEYQRAVQNYEKVAQSAVNNNLMKWSVKDYFLKAGICHLASQVTNQHSISPPCLARILTAR